MKLLLCSNVRLNAECLESLDIKLSHKWKANLSEKFADLFDQSLQKHCSYIFLCGRIFGTERVTEEVIDNLFKIIKSNKNTNVLMFLAINEYNRISYRNDIPENLHLLCIGSADSYVDDEIALMIDKNTVRIQLSDLDEISIQKREENNFVLCSAEGEQNIASFEPIGFDDIQDTEYGYSILEWDEEKIKSFTNVHMQKYAYKSVSLKILSHHQNSIKFFQTQLRHVVLREKCVEMSEKRAFSRLRNTFEPLQNRGSRVRVLPPLPRKKPSRFSTWLFSTMFALTGKLC